MCDILDYKFTQNRRAEELFKIVKQLLNRKCAVFVFDEVDKLEDFDFLYLIAEEIFRKSMIIITNYHDFLTGLDDRLKSRLMMDTLEFKPYNYDETKGILKLRKDYAFFPGVWDDEAMELVVNKTVEVEDMRKGLHLLRESANSAEGKSSKKILIEHVKDALSKTKEFTVKDSNELSDDEKEILEMVNSNSGKRIGDLYKMYTEKGGSCVYKSFQRKVDKLGKNKFISIEKIKGGEEGNTTIVKKNQVKLTEF
jgi:cell division control protein 6